MNSRGKETNGGKTPESSERHATRRKMYADMDAAEKNALLLQRRVKKREITTKRLCLGASFTNATEPISTLERNVVVRNSYSISKEDMLSTGKHMLHPLSVFEKGSTSGTSNKSTASNLEILALNDGCIKNKRNISRVVQLRSDYVPLKNVSSCEFCSAKKFEYESHGFCCGSGTINLTSHQMPPELRNLYVGTCAKSKHFQTYIRTYNNLFAFTSLGVSYDKDLAKRNHGIYTFRVQGQMYHFIDNLYPGDGMPKNLQLYFYDNEHEVANRMACSDKIDELIVRELIDILKDNSYSIFLRTLSEIPNLQNHHIALKCDAGLDQRVFNLSSSTEVAAIWVDENDVGAIHVPHIQIYTHNNRTQMVNYYFGCYDPLQYPLLFPYGQSGWHCGIKKFHNAQNKRGHTLIQSEQLPNIKKFSSIDGYLDMENQLLQKEK